MRIRPGRRAGWALVGLAATIGSACAPCRSCPPGPPAVPTPKAVAVNAPSLPPGCRFLTDGTDAMLSRDARLLVFARWRTITGETVHDHREHFGDMGAEPLIPSLWIRDLVTRSERPFPRWTASGLGEKTPDWHGLPVSWAPGGALLLADGAILDPRSGAAVTTVLRPIPSAADAPPPGIEDLRAWAWSADGRRLAYFDRVPAEQPGETGRRAPFVRESGTAARRIDLTRAHEGRSPAWTSPGDYVYGGRLAWSPDGETLLLRLRFAHMSADGPSETEGIGLHFVRDGGVSVLGEFPFLDGAPPERAGEDVWDPTGRRCVFVGATAAGRPSFGTRWAGTMDVYVAETEGPAVRRLTHDGLEKGRACIDPSGTRVACLVGEGAARDWGAAGPRVRLRVVNVDTGDTWESPLAPPPDAWAPLGTLGWTPDGKRVVYAYEGIEGAVYAQDVPPGSP